MNSILHDHVYISGPIMYATEEQKGRFAEAARSLTIQGLVPVNPVEISADCGGTCERAPHEKAKQMEHAWSCFMRWDIIEMLRCEYILMLPGWEQSRGAQHEFNVAVVCGLKVLYYADGDVTGIDQNGSSYIILGADC